MPPSVRSARSSHLILENIIHAATQLCNPHGPDTIPQASTWPGPAGDTSGDYRDLRKTTKIPLE